MGFRRGSSPWRSFATVVVLVVLVADLGFLNVYASPPKAAPNQQLTYQEASSAAWMVDHGDGVDLESPGMGLQSYIVYHVGYDTARDRFADNGGGYRRESPRTSGTGATTPSVTPSGRGRF